MPRTGAGLHYRARSPRLGALRTSGAHCWHPVFQWVCSSMPLQLRTPQQQSAKPLVRTTAMGVSAVWNPASFKRLMGRLRHCAAVRVLEGVCVGTCACRDRPLCLFIWLACGIDCGIFNEHGRGSWLRCQPNARTCHASRLV